VLESRRVVDHQSGGFDLRRRLRHLELDRLKIGEGLSELLALLQVPDRRVERALRDADHLRTDSDSSAVQRRDRDLVALSDGAEHVLFRYLAVVEKELDRARCANAELVFFLADLESVEVALDDECGNAAIAGRWILNGQKL